LIGTRFSCATIWRCDIPLALNPAMTGDRRTAKSFARAWRSSMFARKFAGPAVPNFTPRALAAARAAFVREPIRRPSNSAKFAMLMRIILPSSVLASMSGNSMARMATP